MFCKVCISTAFPMHRAPAVLGALTGRLAAALEPAGGLLGAVSLQPNSVLPLLRAACQALTVDGGLDTLQVKCIGARRPICSGLLVHYAWLHLYLQECQNRTQVYVGLQQGNDMHIKVQKCTGPPLCELGR